MATPDPHRSVTKTFISYSWDDDAHKEWVKQLAIRLRRDGVDVTLDRWHAVPGDQLPLFMETAVRDSDFVIAVCTSKFKQKADRRGGGVGYEGDVMTAEVFTDGNRRKFIPVLRRGSWKDAAPSWLKGSYFIDLSGDPYSESNYQDLLRTLHGAREEAPRLGPRPNFEGQTPVPLDRVKRPFTALMGRSRLRRPEALWLRADRPEHLIGREADVERLTKLCKDRGLIFLEGESGAGKSSLLQSGLVPAWVESKSSDFLPIYLDVWGEDWEKGPRQSLCDCVWKTLSARDRAILAVTEPPRPEELVAYLGNLRASLRRTPVILLDQFDDYQSRHRSLFLPPRRKTWLSAKDLVKKNAFWRDLQTLLVSEAIHCVIATRSDAAAGLESVRVIPSRTYRLERLAKSNVETLLTRLTETADPADPVVVAPEAGWDRLKERLARDLDQDGTILPVQMRTAFRGLAALPALTPRAYDREGALQGIEAATIEQQIKNAALNSGLSKSQVLSLLLALVDRERLKTLAKTEDELKKAVIADGSAADEEAVNRGVPIALEFLEDREIVRQRLDPDTRGHVWLLDHDYLANGILEADRRANVWPSLLQEKFRSYEDAGARYGRKWWALLSPVQQIGLFWQRLRGRLRYGRHGSYALLSLARWAPYVLLVFLCVFGWQWNEDRKQAQRDHDEARALLSAVGTPTEWDAIWRLAASRDSVRYSFLKQALSDPNDCRRIGSRADNVVQSLVGLSTVRREDIIGILFSKVNKNYAFSNHNIASTASQLLASRSMRSDKVLGSNFLIEAIEKNTDPSALRALAEGLKAVLGKLEPGDARKASAVLVAAIEKATDPFALRALGEGLSAVPGKLEPGDARKAYAVLMAAIEKTTDFDALVALGWGLKAVLGKLEPGDAQKAQAAIVTVIHRTTGNPFSYVPHELAKIQDVVPGKLEPGDAREAFAVLMAAIEKTINPYVRYGPYEGYGKYAPSELTGDLTALLGKLETADTKACAALVAAIEKTTDPHALRGLAEGLTAVPAKLEPADAQKAYTVLVAAIEETTDADALRVLAGCIRALPGRVDAATLLNLAKFPNCVGELRAAVLEIIERQNPPAKFDGDIWKMVEWAQQQKPPWDLTSPPKRTERQ